MAVKNVVQLHEREGGGRRGGGGERVSPCGARETNGSSVHKYYKRV
jgi:hypothetical protein